MASQIGDFLKARFLRHLFRFETWVVPTSVDLHLFNAGGVEVAGNGYAPKTISLNGATGWSIDGAAVSNAATITHGTPTGGGWGQLYKAELRDGSGNVWATADLGNAPVATAAGSPVAFAPGKLVFRLQNVV